MIEEKTAQNQQNLTIEMQNSSTDIANILGKSEQTLKTEFYQFKVKQLMNRVGIFINSAQSQKEIQDKLVQAHMVGVQEVLVSPFYYSIVKGFKSKLSKDIKYCVAVDFPLGETTSKQKVIGVKEACKKGADYVFCTMPKDCLKLACFSEEKKKILRGRRASKKPFGLVIGGDIEQESLQKILKNTDGINTNAIVIEGIGVDVNKLQESLLTANTYKGKRKVYALTDISSTENLSKLISCSVDKIYTPFAHLLGKQLIEDGPNIIN